MQGLIDIHCHLLYGVDDGANNLDESLKMLRMQSAQGVASVILTPHCRVGIFETPQTVVEEHFRNLSAAAKKAGIPVKLYLGCEYHTSRFMIGDLLSGRRPTLAGSPYVLVEFSGAERYSVILKQIVELRNAALIPVIAHPERIACLISQYERFSELTDAGAQLQITAGTLIGDDGWGAGRLCRKMVKDGLVSFAASDAHGAGRVPNLKECDLYLQKKYSLEISEHLLRGNAQTILNEGTGK